MSEAAAFSNPVNTAVGRGLETPRVSTHHVCELVVETTVPFPELAEAVGEPDIRFEVLPAGEGFSGNLDWFRQCTSPNNEMWVRFADCAGDYVLRFHDQCDFLISRDGREVQCRPLPDTAESTIRHLFLDQIVPLLLSQREALVLHASAILTPQGVIAFVGKSGQGKSTLAASFAYDGFQLISDDYLVLRKRAPGRFAPATHDWVAVPSYPGVRLWPETSDGIFSTPPDSTEIASYTDKRRVSDPALIPFAGAPSALKCLYFLDDVEENTTLPGPSVTPLNPKDAFMRLVSFAFNLDIRDKMLLERQFEAIGHISSEWPCFQLNYARDFAMLPAVRRLIVSPPARGES